MKAGVQIYLAVHATIFSMTSKETGGSSNPLSGITPIVFVKISVLISDQEKEPLNQIILACNVGIQTSERITHVVNY